MRIGQNLALANPITGLLGRSYPPDLMRDDARREIGARLGWTYVTDMELNTVISEWKLHSALVVAAVKTETKIHPHSISLDIDSADDRPKRRKFRLNE